jgi:rare lipoprotein A (peptidoglycan hydrolase)
VRHKNVVAVVALIALIATVAVPGPASSQAPSPASMVDPNLFEPVEVGALERGTAVTIQPQDPGARSAGNLDESSTLIEPSQRSGPVTAPVRPAQNAAPPRSIGRSAWNHDREVSWYGPGLYGNGMACGRTLTKALIGVAHRTLPCGTLVTFRNPTTGATVTAPVVDRGPFVSDRDWDLTRGACMKIDHCFTGSIDWKLATAS